MGQNCHLKSDAELFLWIQGEKDDKIIAVCADDPEYRHYTDISQLPPHRLQEIRRFFEDCILLINFIFQLLVSFVAAVLFKNEFNINGSSCMKSFLTYETR